MTEETRMKAVGFFKSHATRGDEVLLDIDLPKPSPTGRDLLVKVEAAAINPVDVKTRMRMPAGEREVKVLGYDAAGIVEAVGPEVSLFKPGDAVFYAGSIVRPGTYAEYHLVDERIVGPKPKSLSFAEAAALPLTSITAWEMLFDRLRIGEGGASVLVIGGTGGVGSMAVQLARTLTDLTVITTASRPDGREWCRKLGAHHVVDHSKPLAAEIGALQLPPITYVFSTTATDTHYPAIAEVIAPQGRFGLIDDPAPLDLRLVKLKSVSFHWENMFTRAVFGTPDMDAQNRLLKRVSELIDNGSLKTTLAEILGPISAATVGHGHERIQASHAPGKMVMTGF
jgi:NADPH:quinone reductase